MKNMLKKIVLVVLMIFILYGISRIYCFVIINKIYASFENFISEGNRYYCVTNKRNNEVIYQEKLFYKDNRVKYLRVDNNLERIYLEIKDFELKKLYKWNARLGKIEETYEDEIYFFNERTVRNVSDFITHIYENNKFNWKKFLKIHYIIPTKYEGKGAYKIVTKTEIIIVDKETGLPKYSCENVINSNRNDNIKNEYFYEYEIGSVTEEDMQIP